MDLRYSHMAKLSQLSNEKIFDKIKTKFAESNNAAISLIFDDKLLVLDEEKEDFYVADYTVNKDVIKVNKWEKVNLIPDNDSLFEELSYEYFDPLNKEEVNVKTLVEAFKLKYSDAPVKRLINETVIDKHKRAKTDQKIKSLSELREAKTLFYNDINEVLNDPKIMAIKNRLDEESPSQSIVSYIDFKNPISIKLLDESYEKTIPLSRKKSSPVKTHNILKKVKNLWSSKSFKNDFSQLLEYYNNSEDKEELIEKFLLSRKDLLILNEEDLTELIVKTALMVDAKIDENKLVEEFISVASRDSLLEAREKFIERNNISLNENEGEGDAGDYEGDSEDDDTKEDEKSDNKEDEESIDEDTINSILSILRKISDNLKEKSAGKKYIESFIKSLEDAKVGSIPAGKLKEILDFLMDIKKDSEKEEE